MDLSTDACEGITYEGCCDGDILTWCEGDTLETLDCAEAPACGWNADAGYYDCNSAGASGPPQFPMTCDGSTQCTPDCEAKTCGSDGCGGSCGDCGEGMACGASGSCVEAGGGSLSCMEIDACIGDCVEGDLACQDACVGQGSATGASEYDAFSSCVSGCEDIWCFLDTCMDETANCSWDVTGSATCGDVLDCLGLCDPSDAACGDACFETGTAAAQSAYLAAVYCIGAFCAPDDEACATDVQSDPATCGGYVSACVAQ